MLRGSIPFLAFTDSYRLDGFVGGSPTYTALATRDCGQYNFVYSQTFCKYGAPAMTLPGLHGTALRYS